MRVHTHHTNTYIRIHKYIYTLILIVIFCGVKELHILRLLKIYSMRNIFKMPKLDLYYTYRPIDFLNFAVLMNDIQLYEPTYTQPRLEVMYKGLSDGRKISLNLYVNIYVHAVRKNVFLCLRI